MVWSTTPVKRPLVILNRRISGLLFQVEPTDPLTLATVALLVSAASLIASYLPARRAGHVDPAICLRASD